ncbi:MAG: glycosyltransferase [Bacteroidales bacterium]|jgi:glycosyltransferase involved in cell wall biosynthesis|nr:glycosyltransferase [Bacteroidales bacterium]
MNNPTISVLMPVYNAEKFLREAIESILNQTYSDFEFIIINDGSTDTSEEIILSYNDARIIYINNGTNLRLIKTLNKGINLAKGKYIARMDADDISLPNRLEEQIKIFSYYKGITLVHARSLLISECGKVKHLNRFSIGFEALRFITPFICIITHPTIMVKTDILKQYYYYDNEKARHIEDLYLWTKMLNDGCFFYTIENPLLHYRVVSNSITKTFSSVQLQNQLVLIREYLNEYFRSITVSNSTLSLLLGDQSHATLNNFIKIKLFLKTYLKQINENILLTKHCRKDISYWSDYTLVKIALLVILHGNLIVKIKVFFLFLFDVHMSFYYKHLKKFLY